ncbi:MAG: 23S rRNA (guanine1835-N2)-methyltransferase [Candidatus Paceibacteria bacterium]
MTQHPTRRYDRGPLHTALIDVTKLPLDTHLSLSSLDLDLWRYPYAPQDPLRAWDAADELLLEHLLTLPAPTASPLIVNDSFGALGCALQAYQPISWSDSWLAHEGLQANLGNNSLPPEQVTRLPSTDSPTGKLPWVVIKVPKNLALFEDQLLRLRPCLTPDSRVWVTGMIKNMPRSVWQKLERIIGPTQTSLARKKARYIEVTLDPTLTPATSPYPTTWHFDPLGLEEGLQQGLDVINHANVFSREKPDIGTRLLLQHMPAASGAKDIIDLGCGNGIVGMVAALSHPDANLTFIDESYMAIASAKANFRQLPSTQREAHFTLGDGLQGSGTEQADLILCNPPFHAGHAVGDASAMAMFEAAARVLKADGELWVVGNRHLDYHVKLKRWFTGVTLAASNNKFVVLKATSPRLG